MNKSYKCYYKFANIFFYEEFIYNERERKKIYLFTEVYFAQQKTSQKLNL